MYRLFSVTDYQTKNILSCFVFKNRSLFLCGNKMPTRCNKLFLLQILLLAQRVSGITMTIIRSSRVLYRWLLAVVLGALVFKLSVSCGAEGYVSSLRAAALLIIRGMLIKFANSILEGLFITNLYQMDKQSTKFTIWKCWKGCVKKLDGNDPNFLPTTQGSCSSLQTGHITSSSTPYRQPENQSTKYHRQRPSV